MQPFMVSLLDILILIRPRAVVHKYIEPSSHNKGIPLLAPSTNLTSSKSGRKSRFALSVELFVVPGLVYALGYYLHSIQKMSCREIWHLLWLPRWHIQLLQHPKQD